MTLRVLGVDPGLTRCGYGVLDAGRGRSATLVDVGVVRSSPEEGIDQRLLVISRGLEEKIEEHAPDVVAIERVFSQNNTSTVMGTAQVSGVAILLAAQRGIRIAMHTPSEVKAAVTGSGRADKKQIQTMLVKLLHLEAPPKPADAADAVAIALTQLWRGPGPVRLDSSGRARTSAQSVWAEAERSARRARESSTSRF
ncbi:crossover junction endodeoxyribonuclease RuvC [Brachybacterium halotolerans subsp. kimchii]|uniref:crossover junction endodeoxyribonuclease RuvC n=1 Tax=Brachybacterium TaxID=43668 RepID=UPI001E411D34|nr:MULTISPECIES: crossover junction endodeoxyribonuclease RuvC [Brachybacterium]MCG7309912.1 crossover junction endodeoxyribonuclease RuvC [Brachybacterium sp. ACRRE]UEJ83391.1 crossover junction endodeoxyribonuclease RuvC [Brachybacterium halotolerans subsp. kimchii]